MAIRMYILVVAFLICCKLLLCTFRHTVLEFLEKKFREVSVSSFFERASDRSPAKKFVVHKSRKLRHKLKSIAVEIRV